MAILETHWYELIGKLNKILEQTNKIESRVASLEKWRAWLAGGVAGMGLLWGVWIFLMRSGVIQFATRQ